MRKDLWPSDMVEAFKGVADEDEIEFGWADTIVDKFARSPVGDWRFEITAPSDATATIVVEREDYSAASHVAVAALAALVAVVALAF